MYIIIISVNISKRSVIAFILVFKELISSAIFVSACTKKILQSTTTNVWHERRKK